MFWRSITSWDDFTLGAVVGLVIGLVLAGIFLRREA